MTSVNGSTHVSVGIRPEKLHVLPLHEDETATSAEGREQPTIEPEVATTPAPVAEAPDTTTGKTMHEDPTKLDQSGEGQAAGEALAHLAPRCLRWRRARGGWHCAAGWT